MISTAFKLSERCKDIRTKTVLIYEMLRQRKQEQEIIVR